MSIQEQVTLVDFNELTKACESLNNTMGVKVRTVGVKKVAVITEFVRQLLAVPEAREGELEDIIFTVVADIQEKLGTDSLRKTLTLLETPVTEEAPSATVPPVVEPVAAAPVDLALVTPVATPATLPDPPPPKKPGRKKLPNDTDTAAAPPKEKKVRKSRDGMNKVLDITRFVWKNTGLSIDEVAKAMTAAGITFSEATLGFEYRAVHRSRQILKEMKVIQ